MTVFFESAQADSLHRAYTGFKGIVLPYPKQQEQAERAYPLLLASDSPPAVRLQALQELCASDTASGFMVDAPEIREEIDHFQVLGQSQVASALFVANRGVRWNLTRAFGRAGATRPPPSASRSVIAYFRRCLHFWLNAYPLIEGHYLSRFPDERRRENSGNGNSWHPLAEGVVRTANELSARAGERLSHRQIAGICDTLFVAPSASGAPVDDLVSSARPLGVRDRLGILSSGVGTGSLGVLLRNLPVAWSGLKPQFAQMILRRDRDPGRNAPRLPMLLIAGQTIDPTVLELGLPTHPGLDHPLSAADKVLLDFWWLLLRTVMETEALLRWGSSTQGIQGLLDRRMSFYWIWSGGNATDTPLARRWLADILQNYVADCHDRLMEALERRSRWRPYEVALAAYRRLTGAGHLAEWTSSLRAGAMPEDDDAIRIKRLLNCSYLQI